VSWIENGVRRYSHGYPTPGKAEEVRAGIALRLADGKGGLPEVPAAAKKSLSALAKDWLERREATHRSARHDGYRWKNHLEPTLGHLRPDALDGGALRKLIESKLAEGNSPASVRLMLRLLSTFYTDLIEDGAATKNPARLLPKKVKRLVRPSHDPKKTPFIEKRADIVRLYQALPEPVNVAFAIGALAGLRTGEVLGLKWSHVDLPRKRIHVQESITGPLKDDDSRIVPIVAGLATVLATWRKRNPDAIHVCHMNQHAPGEELRAALKRLQLRQVTWYQATRHTFASHWVLGGNSIEKLREIMGHSSVQVTERYAHLLPELFAAKDLERADLDLAAAG
jgi:integrase